MMNKALFSILLLASIQCMAQVTKVTYRLEIPVDETIAADYYGEIKRREYKELFKYADFELLFNSKQAKFLSPAILESDDFEIKEAAAQVGFDNPVYSDVNFVYGYGGDGLGLDGPYLVKAKFSDWQLRTETKIIAGYKCYKAERIFTDGDHIPPQVAWYCPDIKSRFGPMGSGNLPGTILQLEQVGYIYTATKVEFNVKDKIDFPKGIKTITEAEYDKIWDEWEIKEMGKTFRE